MLAYIHTQEAVDGRVMMTSICTHTHAHPWSYVCRNTHASGARLLQPFQDCFHYTHTHTHTHTSSCLLKIWLIMTLTHTDLYTHAHAWLLAQRHIFLHVCRSVFLARIRRYTQLAYLFRQCARGFLSRDGRIADCAGRHSGVERPFSIL